MKAILIHHDEAAAYAGRALAAENIPCCIGRCQYSFHHPILGKHMLLDSDVYEICGHADLDSIKAIMQDAARKADAEFFVLVDGAEANVFTVKGWATT